MSETGNILEESAVFSRISSEGKKRVTVCSTKRRIQEGEILAAAGETASYFYILGAGSLLLSMAEGRAVVLKTPGDFAAMELVSRKGVYKSTVTALCGGFVYFLERKAFLELIREDSADAGELMRAWHNYLEETAPFVKTHEYDVTGFEYAY